MKSKNFIKKAEYPGGADALKKFVKQYVKRKKLLGVNAQL